MFTLGVPVQIKKPAPGVLVVERRRAIALGRLSLALAFAAIFYHVLLRLGDMPDHVSLVEHLQARLDATWLNGLLFFLPAVILPEVMANLRVLMRGDSLRFDRATRSIQQNGRTVAAFSDVRRLELSNVNGTCEEMTLHAALKDGRRLGIATDAASAATINLAHDLGDLLGVPLSYAHAAHADRV